MILRDDIDEDYTSRIICYGPQKMKKTAEDYLGTDVTSAVITVPAISMILKGKLQKKQVRFQTES